MPRKSKDAAHKRVNHNKVGVLSVKDKEYIAAQAGLKSDEEIGAEIKRSTETVMKFRVQHLAANKGDKTKIADNIRLKEELRQEPEWALTKKNYSPEELSLFEFSYIQLINQFKGDVLPTERKQIFMALNTEIKIYRHNAEVKRTQIEIERMELMLDAELDKDNNIRDDDMIQAITGQINGARSAAVQRAKEYNDLAKQFTESLKSLKGTREARLQKAEDNNQKMVGLLRKLEEEDMRKSVALEQFIMSEAVKSEKKKLGQLHTFMDGRVDPPILDSETVCEISTTPNIKSGGPTLSEEINTNAESAE